MKKGKEKLSKAHYSKNLRRALAQHQVDITQIMYSANSTQVFLSGLLLKNNGEEFNTGAIQELHKELCTFGTISSDLANWVLSNDSIVKIVVEEEG